MSANILKDKHPPSLFFSSFIWSLLHAPFPLQYFSLFFLSSSLKNPSGIFIEIVLNLQVNWGKLQPLNYWTLSSMNIVNPLFLSPSIRFCCFLHKNPAHHLLDLFLGTLKAFTAVVNNVLEQNYWFLYIAFQQTCWPFWLALIFIYRFSWIFYVNIYSMY